MTPGDVLSLFGDALFLVILIVMVIGKWVAATNIATPLIDILWHRQHVFSAVMQ